MTQEAHDPNISRDNLIRTPGLSLDKLSMPSGQFAIDFSYRDSQGALKLRRVGLDSTEVENILHRVTSMELPAPCSNNEDLFRALRYVGVLTTRESNLQYKNGFFKDISAALEAEIDSYSYEQFKSIVSVTKVRDSIFILSFPMTAIAAAVFLRMQEHYEGPFFKGKVFSREEFKEWYQQHQSPRNDFSYYDDWGGFNVPSQFAEPFVRGDFAPYSAAEEHMRRLIQEHTEGLERYYLIGLGSENGKQSLGAKRHELCHALFSTEPEYQERALKIISGVNKEAFCKKLTEFGYHSDTHDDEFHAYLSDDPDLFVDIANLEQLPDDCRIAHEQLRRLFEGYIPEL